MFGSLVRLSVRSIAVSATDVASRAGYRESGDMQREWDVIIVGGGSAGLSAALMLVRARRKVLVLDGGAPRNRFAAHMHGVLGRDGWSPLELLEHGRAEVERYGGEVRSDEVASAELNADAGGTGKPGDT